MDVHFYAPAIGSSVLLHFGHGFLGGNFAKFGPFFPQAPSLSPENALRHLQGLLHVFLQGLVALISEVARRIKRDPFLSFKKRQWFATPGSSTLSLVVIAADMSFGTIIHKQHAGHCRACWEGRCKPLSLSWMCCVKSKSVVVLVAAVAVPFI